MRLVVIVKPWLELKQGQIVDAAGWRNVDALIAQRHVRLATVDEIERYKSGQTQTGLAEKPKRGSKKAAA